MTKDLTFVPVYGCPPDEPAKPSLKSENMPAGSSHSEASPRPSQGFEEQGSSVQADRVAEEEAQVLGTGGQALTSEVELAQCRLDQRVEIALLKHELSMAQCHLDHVKQRIERLFPAPPQASLCLRCDVPIPEGKRFCKPCLAKEFAKGRGNDEPDEEDLEKARQLF
jgi:hypothetical protein